MLSVFTYIARRDEGQTSVEYTLVMLLTAIVLVVAVAVGLTGLLDDLPSQINSLLP